MKHDGFSSTLSMLQDCRAPKATQISISHYKEQFQELSVLFISVSGKKEGRLLRKVVLSTTEERHYDVANTSFLV